MPPLLQEPWDRRSQAIFKKQMANLSQQPYLNLSIRTTGKVLQETHWKNLKQNPPEIFSGNPPEIFSGNPPEIFSGKPHRKSCQRPTLNQIKSGGITVNPPEILSDQIKSGGITVNPPEILSDRPALNQSKFCGGITVKSPEIQLADLIGCFET